MIPFLPLLLKAWSWRKYLFHPLTWVAIFALLAVFFYWRWQTVADDLRSAKTAFLFEKAMAVEAALVERDEIQQIIDEATKEALIRSARNESLAGEAARRWYNKYNEAKREGSPCQTQAAQVLACPLN